MLKKLINRITQQSHTDHKTELRRRLIRHEARLGGELFGPVVKGGTREFFCLDEHTWVWHEERPSNDGTLIRRTTRYDIRPQGIFKAQDGLTYKPVTISEAQRLYDAAQIYSHRISREIYKDLSLKS